MPRDAISIPAYAATVNAMCRELGIESATVVGNSMGGLIAVEPAIGYHGLVERLVLVDAASLSTEQLHFRSLSALDRSLRFLRLAEVASARRRSPSDRGCVGSCCGWSPTIRSGCRRTSVI
jgi:4,5:9,10-diseco-3-hydroxy-5,9,17-trioxoandrosta-1(10),2-diene-4-oate hydrolase